MFISQWGLNYKAKEQLQIIPPASSDLLESKNSTHEPQNHSQWNSPVSWKGKYHTLFYSTPWMTPQSRSTGTWRWVPEEWCPGCGSSLTYRIPHAVCMILPCRGSDPQRKQFCETQKIFSFSSWKKQTLKAGRNCTRWKKPNKTHHKLTVQIIHTP